MIKVKKWIMNPNQTACHVLSDETGEAVIIDACAYYRNERKALLQYIADEGLKPVHNLLTHAHFDHLLANDLILDQYGLWPEVHEGDTPLMGMVRTRINEVLGEKNFPNDIPMPQHYLKSKDIVRFGNHELLVLHTPGHSSGSVIYYCSREKIAFTGDTLLPMGIGRTDLPGGSLDDLMESLQFIMTRLADDVVIYPGHGGKTTIAHERACNPYLP